MILFLVVGENGEIAHADRTLVLLVMLGCASFAIRRPYIGSRPPRHCKDPMRNG